MPGGMVRLCDGICPCTSLDAGLSHVMEYGLAHCRGASAEAGDGRRNIKRSLIRVESCLGSSRYVECAKACPGSMY